MASFSSHAAISVVPTDRPSVQLWLPECFNSMLVDLIAQESDVDHQGALGRCLKGLRLQTSTSHALASHEVLSEATLSLMRFSQYQIQFGNGVDPPRLSCLCNMLHAATRLFDDELWRTENAGIFLSLPEYCSACDIFGHATADCTHFHGHSRTEVSSRTWRIVDYVNVCTFMQRHAKRRKQPRFRPLEKSMQRASREFL